MEYRPWQFNTYAHTYISTYVGTYGGTLVAAVTLQVDCPREPCPLALLENVVVLALTARPRRSDVLGESFVEGVSLGVQKRGRPTLLGSLPRYRNKAELVSAANQVANPLWGQ